MPIGITVSMSMEWLWQDAFTIAKITMIVKMHVLISSRAVLQIAPVRLVEIKPFNYVKFMSHRMV